MYGYGNMFSPSNRLFSGSGASPLWNGLQAYYTADNTPNDALGNYNATLVNGATYGTGIINQGFSFDGVNDYVDMGNVLDFDGTTPFSFSFWLNPTSVGNKNIINKWSGTNTGYIIFFLAGKLRFALSNNITTNIARIETVDTYTTGMQNFVFAYDGSKSASGMKIYRNGVLQTVSVLNDTLTGTISTTASFELGRINSALGWYQGIMDEISVFGRELTLSDAVELYNSGAGKQY
jgi:hypothetical protein